MRIKWDSGELYDDPNLSMGEWSIIVPDERVKEYVEALIILGFTPEVTLG